MVEFAKHEFGALIAHASKDPARFNLHQIAVWSDGSAAATDGRRLLMCRQEGGKAWAADRGEPVLVPLEAAKQTYKVLRARETVDVCLRTLRTPGFDVPFSASENLFPPVHVVVRTPKRDPDVGDFGIDAALLGGTMKHLAKIHPAVRVSVYGALEPIHVTCSDPGREREWLAVVMPCWL